MCTINLRQEVTCQKYAVVKPPFLPYGEPNLCNSYILKDPDCINCFCIYFSCHCVFNQDDLDTDLLEDVHLTKEFLQPTKKTKDCTPTQIKIGENNKQKENTPKRQEIQECEHTST